MALLYHLIRYIWFVIKKIDMKDEYHKDIIEKICYLITGYKICKYSGEYSILEKKDKFFPEQEVKIVSFYFWGLFKKANKSTISIKSGYIGLNYHCFNSFEECEKFLNEYINRKNPIRHEFKPKKL